MVDSWCLAFKCDDTFLWADVIYENSTPFHALGLYRS